MSAPVATPFSLVADGLLAALQPAFGQSVRVVALLPAVLTEGELRRIAGSAPGVYVGFGGAQRGQSLVVDFAAHWTVTLVVGQVGADLARVQGDAAGIGLFEMATVAISALDGLVIPGIGTVEIAELMPVGGEALEKLSVALWALRLKIPMPWPGTQIEPAMLPRLPGGGGGRAAIDGSTPGGLPAAPLITTHTDWLPPGSRVTSLPDDGAALAINDLTTQG
jgi:hypothetical protein